MSFGIKSVIWREKRKEVVKAVEGAGLRRKSVWN